MAARRYLPLSLVGVALMLAACGSSSTTASSTTTKTAAPSTVKVSHTTYGNILVNSSGDTLYMLTADTSTTSACTGACLGIWPPLSVTGTPTAGSGVKGSLLSTLTLSNGQRQVTYNGHPLYTYSGDSGPGQFHGQGLHFPITATTNPKGLWWVEGASGAPVTHPVSSTSSGTSSGGGYGSSGGGY